MKESKLGWIAGIIDGEGTIGLGRQLKQNGNFVYAPVVSVSNTNLVIHNTLLSLTNIGEITPGETKKKEHHKKCYYWKLRHAEQEYFLPIIAPYLIAKRLQAELVIEYLSLEKGAGNRRVSNEVDLTRRVIFLELQELNAKGQ